MRFLAACGRSRSNQEILDQVGKHARTQHNMQMTPEMSRKVMSRKVEGLIHDESSEAHRQSTERR